MNVAVCYCFPMVDQRRYFPLARRFADTWRKFPGESLHVICNGATPGEREKAIFQGIPCTFTPHSNLGWDVGAFQLAAETIPCDLLICLGAPVHFHKDRWSQLMLDAYINYGPALYGCWAYLAPDWHVRTTVFWFPPILLQSYPYQVGSSRPSRYEFEHGHNSFTRHVISLGFPTIMVTRRGCFPFDQWRDHAPGVEDSLCLDQHTHL